VQTLNLFQNVERENCAHLSKRRRFFLWELQTEACRQTEAFHQFLIFSKIQVQVYSSVHHQRNVNRQIVFVTTKQLHFNFAVIFFAELLWIRQQQTSPPPTPTAFPKLDISSSDATSLFVASVWIPSLVEQTGSQRQRARLSGPVWVVRLLRQTGRLVLQGRRCHRGCICTEFSLTHTQKCSIFVFSSTERSIRPATVGDRGAFKLAIPILHLSFMSKRSNQTRAWPRGTLGAEAPQTSNWVDNSVMQIFCDAEVRLNEKPLGLCFERGELLEMDCRCWRGGSWATRIWLDRFGTEANMFTPSSSKRLLCIM